MSIALRTAARTVTWIAAILGLGVVLLFLGAQLNNLAFRLLGPLYADPVSPVLSLAAVDVIAPALGMSVAVVVLMTVCLVARLPSGRIAIAGGCGFTLISAWTLGLFGVDLGLISATAATILTLLLFFGIQRLIRRNVTATASA